MCPVYYGLFSGSACFFRYCFLKKFGYLKRKGIKLGIQARWTAGQARESRTDGELARQVDNTVAMRNLQTAKTGMRGKRKDILY
jgi:hypothetical protein